MQDIQKALSQKVVCAPPSFSGSDPSDPAYQIQVSNHETPKSLTASEQNLGFLQKGDPRSELVLAMFKDGNSLPLFLNGFSTSGPLKPVTREQIVAMSPLAQVRKGTYRTPTFVIHGDCDEVVPYSMGVEFIEELKGAGIKGELVVVPGAKHIFDLALKEGDEKWDKFVRPGYEFLFEYL